MNKLNEMPQLLNDGLEMIKMTFLKIFNLGVKPVLDLKVISQDPGLYIPAILLVIFAAATTFYSTKLSMSNTSSDNPQAAAMSKNMMYFGPLMTLWIGFSTPAGLALYWTISSVVQLIQQIYLNKYIIKKKEA